MSHILALAYTYSTAHRRLPPEHICSVPERLKDRSNAAFRHACSHLVGVSLLVHALGSGSILALWGVLAELGLAVGLGTAQERSLCGVAALVLALPRLEDSVLEGAGVAEGHVPWVGGLVHGVEVEGCLELGLATRQEHDAWHGRGDTAVEHLEGVVSDLVGGGLVGALSTGGDHSGLQEDALEHDAVVSHVLESLGPGVLGNLKGGIDVVLAIKHNLHMSQMSWRCHESGASSGSKHRSDSDDLDESSNRSRPKQTRVAQPIRNLL